MGYPEYQPTGWEAGYREPPPPPPRAAKVLAPDQGPGGQEEPEVFPRLYSVDYDLTDEVIREMRLAGHSDKQIAAELYKLKAYQHGLMGLDSSAQE